MRAGRSRIHSRIHGVASTNQLATEYSGPAPPATKFFIAVSQSNHAGSNGSDISDTTTMPIQNLRDRIAGIANRASDGLNGGMTAAAAGQRVARQTAASTHIRLFP